MLYKDIIRLPADFRECMDQAAIDQSPDTWLNFYPHETFIEILRLVLAGMDGSGKSVWINGSYGVGKSHAALVFQKLFMDDESRVAAWLERYKDLIPEAVARSLWARRGERTLVVYDVNGDSLDGKTQFLIRLERTISRELTALGCQVPIASALMPEILKRAGEDPYFFETRDKMQSLLPWLHGGIKDVEALKRELERDFSQNNYGLAHDINKVLEARHIYLPLDAPAFLGWVDECLKVNNFSRLIFIFDEFSGFINRNRSELTAFQELAQAAQQGKFFIMPVTHESLEAFTGRGSDTSRKVSGRFQFGRLEMPNNVAMRLAGHILKPAPEMEEEWREQRAALWQATEGLVKNYMALKAKELDPDDFPNLLPLHPMSAVALKNLATVIGSNQRSLFGFFNNSAFKNFLAEGGIDVPDRQFLTVDQLWDYFMAQSDLGTQAVIGSVRGEYERHRSRLDERQRRVFKAVLLYSLLEREQGNAPLMNASVENIERSFEGDGNIGHDARNILEELAKLRCVSLYNDRCYLFQDATGGQELVEIKKQWLDKFDKLFLRTSISGVKDTYKIITERVAGGRTVHYDIYVGGPKNTNYTGTAREAWGKNGDRALLQFIFARSEEERIEAPQKAKLLATQFAGERALFIVAPELSFCQADARAWEKFVETYARCSRADAATRAVYENELKSVFEDWERKIDAAIFEVWRPNPNGEPFRQPASWEILKRQYLPDWLSQIFPHNPDWLCGGQLTALGSVKNLKGWARAGMRLENPDSGPWRQVAAQWQKGGVGPDPEWFKQNPDHSLTRIRETCETFLKNTADNGCSVVKLYGKLRNEPFGLLPIPHTAMCLGFVLKDWASVKRGLQWSDGSAGKELDEAILTEIIETAIKSSTGEKVRNEKKIYRLGPEEKALMAAISKMAGTGETNDQNVQAALNALAGRLERVAKGVPLWMLPWAMDPEERDSAKAVLAKIANAMRISSRGELGKKAELLREAGQAFRERKDLADVYRNYFNEGSFAIAFAAYAKENAPDLAELASRLGDLSGAWRDSARSLLRETGGWLATREDADKALAETRESLLCCEAMGEIAGTSFHNFGDARKRLRAAILIDNRIPLAVWQKILPAFGRLFELLDQSGSLGERLNEFYGLLKNNSEALKEIFFDPGHKAQLRWIGEKFPGLWPAGLEESAAAYAGLPENSAKMTEGEFEKALSALLENMVRNSRASRAGRLWKERSGEETIGQWSEKFLIPPRFALNTPDSRLAAELAAVLLAPEKASAERLEETARFLEGPDAVRDPVAARDAFLRHISARRHMKVLLWAGQELCERLSEKIGPCPADWLETPGFQNHIDEFVAEYYGRTARPRVERLIGELSENDMRAVLLELVGKVSDAGFYIF
ncbi:MAG: hypothetical protein K2H64_04315, partial [Desulfovibrio sp.]|nr:hypothetical protein [Desulfovibrio sp.]